MSWKLRHVEKRKYRLLVRFSEANGLMACNEAVQQLRALSTIHKVEWLLLKIVRQLQITERLAWRVT